MRIFLKLKGVKRELSAEFDLILIRYRGRRDSGWEAGLNIRGFKRG